MQRELVVWMHESDGLVDIQSMLGVLTLQFMF